MSRYIVAISGASGSAYGLAIIKGLAYAGHEVAVTASREGISILRDETGLDISGMDGEAAAREVESHLGTGPLTVSFHAEDNLYAPISSGSFRTAGMFVAPCSMKTLAGIANGYANNLLERAADVVIKERRPLLIVPRETPLSAIHLENMLKLARLGVHILPAMPGFYNRPQTIEDMVNSIAGRALDLMGVDNEMYKRWE
ncbi:MAG: UbiX family flavin prenyltransferase [Nitrospirae bacterium]|nr:UbiX family flavin prenyltransferase [Nitrospirota bacterium]